MTEVETKTFVETVPAWGGGWPSEGEWPARATGTVAVHEPALPEANVDADIRGPVPAAHAPEADCEGCAGRVNREEFSWARVVEERKSELAAEKTLTAGAKFRF